ncbi:hypothetical protein [Emticicia fontis]
MSQIQPISFIAISADSFEQFKQDQQKLTEAIEKNPFFGKQNFSTEEAMEFVQLSRPLFDRAVQQGYIKPVNHTDKKKTYLLEDLMNYLRKMRDYN